ncbi:hypothetical protein B9Z55_018736 [Caenorhabditis nigoni]|uniref:Glucuronosyltransferase n=1 Tax=Caenorhabditis nigoni TaxID=1611254 RepID=A0A2G5TFP9_9PELO|nr:hypothetical protein B9Z55_018736 [Caenorhabditis nigoni]
MRILILPSLIFTICTSYKVLVFNPALGGSHSNFLGKISDILIDAGHEVTMLIPVFMHEKRDLVGSKKVEHIIRVEQDPRIFQMQQEATTDEMIKKRVWKMDSNLSFMFSVN